mmetsp:Transcript_1669/g.3384  ORF Transcript_1669/g.3384 Transcript_1669/m.3384 type:complete len:100 (+) Transcript_1669:23-322(+)
MRQCLYENVMLTWREGAIMMNSGERSMHPDHHVIMPLMAVLCLTRSFSLFHYCLCLHTLLQYSTPSVQAVSNLGTAPARMVSQEPASARPATERRAAPA